MLRAADVTLMPDYQEIIYELEDGVARITLNRPEKRNALNDRLIGELKNAFAQAESEAAVVLLQGAGQDFSAGADLSQLEKIAQGSILDNIEDAERFAGLLLQMRSLKKAIIAAVHGRAIAGGAGLASACDMVIAARSATFSYTEVRIGFVPAIVMAIARRNLTEKRAFEILCTAKMLTAEEAERIGLINIVCDDNALAAEAGRMASRITQLSGSAIALTKSLLYQTDALTFEQALRAGVEMNAIARMTPDCREGIRRFLSKQ
ncbi:MAG: enoyl-CoA hydratase/isomerase family protein [Blastocatellia bacterium]|nr:enoyl-CoA hydratase/isomerase family protein [Blastocatellia bacterium]